MKTNPRKGLAAFTLIELMAVITIIVILAGLVVGGLGYVTEKQASSKAKVQIALLSKALEEYKLDTGSYPLTDNKSGAFTSSGGTGTSSILFKALYSDGAANATKIYLPDLDPASSKQGWTVTSGTIISDPWGNQYCYRSSQPLTGTTPNSNTQNPDFDLWSMGKDGSSKPDTPTDKANRDDIKNF